MMLAVHGQRAVGIQGHGPQQLAGHAGGVGQQLAVVSPLDVYRLVAPVLVGREDLGVDAIGVMADLQQHALVIAQLAAAPLPRNQGGRVVADIHVHARRLLPGPFQHRHEGMAVCVHERLIRGLLHVAGGALDLLAAQGAGHAAQ